MADLSRRGFLTQVSVTTGIGLAGGLGLHKFLLSDASAAQVAGPVAPPAAAPVSQATALDRVTLAGPMLIHIRDVATAEVSMMVGAQELVYRDPALVSRLVNTARTHVYGPLGAGVATGQSAVQRSHRADG
jgi:hypothetical protein